mgnify:CR=1 FL=1
MIPMAKPTMGEKEKEAVMKVLDSGMLAHGPEVVKFEEEFSSFTNVKHGAGVSNGTSAIHLALAALGIGPGDEVITTSFSFIASASPILFLGAKPTFTDIDPRTFNMDPSSLKSKISERTKAIIPVHLYGQSAEMDEILELAGDIPVLEDCAQAHGAKYKGKSVGSMGKCGMFSFYPTKNMTTGEGGMVVSNDEEFIEKVRMLRNHGQVSRYDHHVVGYNLRMTSIAAAIGRVQLDNLPEKNRSRIENGNHLTEGLSDIDGITPPHVEDYNRHVFHQYTIRVKNNRDSLMEGLKRKEIGSKVFYPTTLTSSPALRKYANGDYPEAEKACNEVLSLPVHPGVSKDEIDTITGAIRELIP